MAFHNCPEIYGNLRKRPIPLLPKMIKTLLAIGFVFTLSSFYGCGSSSPEKASENKPEDAPYSITLKQVDQHKRLGRKLSDGQYIVMQMGFENLKPEPLQIPASDVVLETMTTDPKEHYVLTPETSTMYDFLKVYGGEKMDRLLGGSAVKLNPRANVERYVVFTIPEAATLDQFQLLFKTYNVRIPLNSQSVVINDYRQKETQ